MKRIVEIKRKGHDGADYHGAADTPEHSTLEFGPNAELRAFSKMAHRTNFAELPSTAVGAATDKLLITIGTGTEVIARSTQAKGRGVNIKTQATTPLATNNVALLPTTNGGMIQTVNAVAQQRFSTKLSLASVAAIIFSAGISENVSDADPTGTAGEGVMFLADPGEAVTTGLTTAQHANWILAFKVNGDDTFAATDIPLVADVPYDLDIVLQPDLTAKCYINGELKGTSPALTADDTINPFIALETSVDLQKDADIRFVEFGPTVVR